MSNVAFLFAGQGAQYPGMGKSLYESSPAAKQVFDLAETLRPGTIAQCFSGSQEELSRTLNTQPCLFAMDLACAAALEEAGIHADSCAGFSLGEVAAAAFCGILSQEDAFRLVCRRAELMDAAAQKHPGAMSAVMKLDAETVEELAANYDKVFPVNYNCPGQIVVSGDSEQLVGFEADVAAKGGRTIRLKVSGGFHSPFMEEASKELAEFMAGLVFAAPRIPLYANVNAEPYGDAAKLLAMQVKMPVRWQNTIERMQQDGCGIFVEVGAGKTLTGFMQKIGGTKCAVRVENPETLREALEKIKNEWGGTVC